MQEVIIKEEKASIGNVVLGVRPSYRERFGLENPPAGSLVKITFMEGCRYSIVWVNCPDLENIVESNFTTKNKALEYANSFGWCVQAGG
jgi:hypothetical protein